MTTDVEELRSEIESLKKQVKELETRSAPAPLSSSGGTIAALSNLLLDPAYPRISFGPNSPALQYPAQFKFEMSSAFGSQDILVLYCKSQFTANSDWEQVASWGVAGSIGFTKTMFASNYIKWLPSGTGEAEIGVDLASFGTQLAGLIITGKSKTPGSTAPIILLDGFIQTSGSGMSFFATDGAIAGGSSYLDIVAPSGGVTNPIIRSTTGKINISDLALTNITASGTVAAAGLTSSGNASISQTLFSAGLNVSNPAAMVFGPGWQTYTPTVTGSGGMTATLIPGTATMNYLRIGPIVFIDAAIGITTGGTPSNYLNISLPVNSTQSTSFMYNYYAVRGAAGGIPSTAGVQNSTQNFTMFAGGSDNINWPTGDHNLFWTTWYPCG